ncbi:MAG: hypothetical protein J0H82_14410 [Alphaproteobacteria bacterium]|jgi:hypothetical protein|nr:hypothetical protein [Alphaproteobacteria bacterium]
MPSAQDLRARVAALQLEISLDYDGRREAVEALLDDCRQLVQRRAGHVGPWERVELEDAGRWVSFGYLKLALVSLETVLAVMDLPPDEYEQGFYSATRNIDASRRMSA